MRTPDIEGLVTHGGPESCVGVPRGRSEALIGVRVGWAIEPRHHGFGVLTSSCEAEGYILGGVSASRLGDPARSENHGMHGVLLLENREIPCSPVRLITGAGRLGNAEAEA